MRDGETIHGNGRNGIMNSFKSLQFKLELLMVLFPLLSLCGKADECQLYGWKNEIGLHLKTAKVIEL